MVSCSSVGSTSSHPSSLATDPTSDSLDEPESEMLSWALGLVGRVVEAIFVYFLQNFGGEMHLEILCRGVEMAIRLDKDVVDHIVDVEARNV